MKPLILKYCKCCGNAFETINELQKFCCNKCANKFNYTLLKVEKVCPACGKKFMGGVSSKYCSKKCSDKATQYVKKSSDRICEVCGKKFKGIGKKKYCSEKCAKKVIYYQKRTSQKNDTLCWSCKNACGGCSWSMNFTPIEGWNAEKVPFKTGLVDESNDYTYKIIECPEFKRG